MYTGRTVRLRLIAYGLALLIAAVPIVSVLCEIACLPPPAASSRCHDQDVPHAGDGLGAAPKACGFEHANPGPAFVRSASGRDVFAVAAARPVSMFPALFTDVRMSPSTAGYGRQRSTGGRTSSLSILRI
jgi:hypothetical protein